MQFYLLLELFQAPYATAMIITVAIPYNTRGSWTPNIDNVPVNNAIIKLGINIVRSSFSFS